MKLSHLKQRRYQELYIRVALGIIGQLLHVSIGAYLLFTAPSWIAGLYLLAWMLKQQCDDYFRNRLEQRVRQSRAVNQDR